MGDDRKKKGSKLPMILGVLVLGIAGAGFVGWRWPETPYLGPIVASVLKQASILSDAGGVYEIRISELRIADAELPEGESVDLQVFIYKLDAQGNKAGTPVFETKKFGDRLGEAGDKDKPPIARWPDNPFTVEWQPGEEFIIEIWDLKGSDNKLVEWRTEKSSGFPLGGTIYFRRVRGNDVKNAKGSFIKFDAKSKGAK